MDQYTQPLDHNENYIQPGGYGTPYASDEDQAYSNMVYHQQMQQPPYPVVHTGLPRVYHLFSCSVARSSNI